MMDRMDSVGHQLIQHIGTNAPLRASLLLKKNAAGAQATLVVGSDIRLFA